MKLRALIIPLILLMPYVAMGTAYSQDVRNNSAASKDAADKQDLEHRLKTNAAFLQSAREIVESSHNEDAMSYLKVAETSLLEGIRHYNDGEYNFALEHIKESTRMAIQAIITARNQQEQNLSTRDYAIQEEIVLKEKHETEHKIESIKKGIPEVAIFIATAERLLSTEENAAAREKLNEAKKLLDSAKAGFSKKRYDSALEDINNAYTLVTNLVKEIKVEKAEFITYPKRAFKNEKEELDYELKKNNSYMFFASQSVSPDDLLAEEMIKDGAELKDEATAAISAGDNKKAIEKLKASTSVLMNAVRTSFKTKKERE